MKNEYSKIRKKLQKNGLTKNDGLFKTIIAANVLKEVLWGHIPSEKYEIFCEAVQKFSKTTWNAGLVRLYLENLMNHGRVWEELANDYKVKNLTYEDLLKPENDLNISEYLAESMRRKW